MTDNVNYNDGKIHGWNGGDCPVHPKSEVEVWLGVDLTEANGIVSPNQAEPAGPFRWSRTGGSSDIIAFRVTKEYKEPKYFWANKYLSGSYGCLYKTEEEAIAAKGGTGWCAKTLKLLVVEDNT